MPLLPVTRLLRVCRVTPDACAASVIVRPSGSMQSPRTERPGWGGFFIVIVPSLFVWATVMSHPTEDRAIVDAGLKALAFDSGPPLVRDEPAATYERLQRARPSRRRGRHQPARSRRQDPPDPGPLRPDRQPLRLVCLHPQQSRRTLPAARCNDARRLAISRGGRALSVGHALPRPSLPKPTAAGTPTCSRLICMSSIAPKVGTKIAVIWIAITIASVGASAIFAAASLADSVSRAARKAEILLAGAPDRGIFDPSIAGDGRRLYMTVSGVSSKAAGSGLGVTAVRSYLARSQDQGRTWQLVGGAVNPDVEASLDDFPLPHRGRWQSEV